MKKWIVIDKDKPLKRGDIIQLDFNISGGLWLSSAEIAVIEWSLKDRDDWEIISNSLPSEGRITFTVRVKGYGYGATGSWLQQQEAAGFVVTGSVIAVTAAKIAGSIIMVGLVMSLVLYEVRQFVEIVPDTITEMSSTTSGKIVMAVVGILTAAYLIKYLKLK